MISNAHLIASTKLPFQWNRAAFVPRKRGSVLAFLSGRAQDPSALRRMCVFGAGLVHVRFSALKNWFSELSLPGRFLLSSAKHSTKRLEFPLQPVRLTRGRRRSSGRIPPADAGTPNFGRGKNLG
jgi:hypothetical protein